MVNIEQVNHGFSIRPASSSDRLHNGQNNHRDASIAGAQQQERADQFRHLLDRLRYEHNRQQDEESNETDSQSANNDAQNNDGNGYLLGLSNINHVNAPISLNDQIRSSFAQLKLNLQSGGVFMTSQSGMDSIADVNELGLHIGTRVEVDNRQETNLNNLSQNQNQGEREQKPHITSQNQTTERDDEHQPQANQVSDEGADHHQQQDEGGQKTKQVENTKPTDATNQPVNNANKTVNVMQQAQENTILQAMNLNTGKAEITAPQTNNQAQIVNLTQTKQQQGQADIITTNNNQGINIVSDNKPQQMASAKANQANTDLNTQNPITQNKPVNEAKGQVIKQEAVIQYERVAPIAQSENEVILTDQTRLNMLTANQNAQDQQSLSQSSDESIDINIQTNQKETIKPNTAPSSQPTNINQEAKSENEAIQTQTPQLKAQNTNHTSVNDARVQDKTQQAMNINETVDDASLEDIIQRPEQMISQASKGMGDVHAPDAQDDILNPQLKQIDGRFSPVTSSQNMQTQNNLQSNGVNLANSTAQNGQSANMISTNSNGQSGQQISQGVGQQATQTAQNMTGANLATQTGLGAQLTQNSLENPAINPTSMGQAAAMISDVSANPRLNPVMGAKSGGEMAKIGAMNASLFAPLMQNSGSPQAGSSSRPSLDSELRGQATPSAKPSQSNQLNQGQNNLGLATTSQVNGQDNSPKAQFDQNGKGEQNRNGQNSASQQIANNIQKAITGGMDRLNIQLQPAHLGKVAIRLEKQDDGQFKAKITVEKAETFELMRQDSKQLVLILQESGLQANDETVSFHLQGQNDQNSQEQQNAKQQNASLKDAQVEELLTIDEGYYGPHFTSSGGLNLWA